MLSLLLVGAFCVSVAGPVWADGVKLPRSLSDQDFTAVNQKQAELGHLLFYDKILSGNQNISCGTCHHPAHGSSDGLSLGIGEGGVGLGPERTPGTGRERIVRRIPRNAPALWNLGAKEITHVMHDGRVSADNLFENDFNTPAEEWLPHGLDNVIAAQALFPMTSEKEMAGQNDENEIAGRVKDRIDYGWPIIAKRVRVIPAYGDRFVDAFDHIDSADQVTIVEIANALSAFMRLEFRSHDSAFDAYLAGDETALTDQEKRGKTLFFGEAGCAQCHAGPLLSDHEFRALALPAFGPGRTRKFDPINRDTGRVGATDDLEDSYKFRTPMLRNVALTGPYGHNGAYSTLEAMIRHHLDPLAARAAWTPEHLVLPDVPWRASADFVIQQDRFEMARQEAVIDVNLPPRTDDEIADLVAFLHSLTGASTDDLPFGVPDAVPSGLSVDNPKAELARSE
jgi:cytochrome c peroxidase